MTPPQPGQPAATQQGASGAWLGDGVQKSGTTTKSAPPVLGDPAKAGPLGAPGAAGSTAGAPMPLAHVRSGRILGHDAARVPVKAVETIFPATAGRYDPNDGRKPSSRM